MSQKLLRIGVPSKGRLSDQVCELISQAGMQFRRQERALFAKVSGLPVELAFLRADDIPVLCEEQALDLGVTGSDLIEESSAKVTVRMPLGIGKCRLSVCVPLDSPVAAPIQLNGLRIATSFPKVTRAYLQRLGIDAHLVELHGSVEIMVSLGVADAIVDLVETGSTLAANKLRVLGDIGNYETVLIQNPKLSDSSVADVVARRLECIVIARDYSLLEYNVPRSKLPDAEAITPGMKSPTISALEDPEWCAVRVMVRRSSIIEVMEQLEKIGASAILETAIKNCRL